MRDCSPIDFLISGLTGDTSAGLSVCGSVRGAGLVMILPMALGIGTPAIAATTDNLAALRTERAEFRALVRDEFNHTHSVCPPPEVAAVSTQKAALDRQFAALEQRVKASPLAADFDIAQDDARFRYQSITVECAMPPPATHPDVIADAKTRISLRDETLKTLRRVTDALLTRLGHRK